MKTTQLVLLILLFYTPLSWAGFSNYNSVLVGNKAGGMGGAFTALSGDPSSCAFYNPATLARMEGSTLSAAVNVYNKYDTEYGGQSTVSTATKRINQGTIVPIPASSGTLHSFRNFTYGLSIVFPDFDAFSGEVKSTTNGSSFVNFRDESLWVGGAFALNLNEKDSVGLTMYYTSRSYSRSVTDKYDAGGGDIVSFNEEKTYSKNSIIYQLGYAHQFNRNWSLGVSMRLPSLEVSSNGDFFQSQIGTISGATPDINETNLKSDSRVPSRYAIGIGYEQKKKQTWALDVSYYAPDAYKDLELASGADFIEHEPTINVSIGGETYIKSWLSWRYGVFTNFSSHPDIQDNPTQRGGDQIDMWGLSTNFSIYTSNVTSVTLGGYYTGGTGHSVQRIEGALTKIERSHQIFSFLAGTSFVF